ncbi:transcriptional regulator [Lecanora helva]
MASVQTAPNLPQGGGNILPPNLNQEQINGYLAKYKQLKDQGVPETDPELLKCHQILSAIKRQQQLQQERKALLQQQAQRSQRNQEHAETNGINGHAPSTSTTTSPGHGTPAAQTNNVSEQPGASSQKPPGKVSGGLSQEQMKTLQTQIMAFKLLSKNNSLPQNLQQQLFKSQPNKAPSSLTQAIASANQALDNSHSTPPRTNGDRSFAPHAYQTYIDPRTYLKPSITYANHGVRENRPFVAALMPTGVDVDQFRRDRELSISNRLLARKLDLYERQAMSGVDGDRMREDRDRIAYNRITSRKSELENLPANLGSWDISKSVSPEPDDSLKRRALIEYKMLCLLPKQRALRQQVHRDMVHYDNLAQTVNRSMYRRPKKIYLHEARMTEKLEKQQRDARETKEKEKQNEHFQSIIHHGTEIAKAAEAQRTRVQKLGRLMLAQHQHIEKEEQKRMERTAKQRLQALKNDDEETYLKLLGQAKDSRISHLLKQTDGFLSQLAASVKQQQRGAVQQYPGDDLGEDDTSDSEAEVEGGPKVDYYAVAHRIKEEIKEQPDNLIGGILKEYQIKGLQWMISLYNNNLNGILADEMGLGKTIQTISLLTYLIRKKNQQGPFLVIVPLSTLTNWNLEFEKWAPSIKRIVYKGPPLARKNQQQQIRYGQFQVLLTTYEYIIKDKPVLSRIKWVHMIVDEGHRMKNAQSKLSSTLTQYYSTRYRLILTGTPLQNNLPELWALLNFVLPTIFKSVKSFDEWFNTPFANTGGQDKMELSEEEQLLVIRRLHKVLRPFLLRRLKKDVEKDLPDKQERVIKCKSSALQAKIYKQLVTYNKISVSDGKGGKTGIRGLSNMLMQLRKLCNHPFVFEQVEEQMNPSKMNNDLLWRTAGKFELLDRMLPKFRATGHRILMFFQMTQIMNIMEDFLRLRGMEYLRLDGATKSDDRSELLAKFNAADSPYFCFLLSTRAGGLGLNLQTADTVIIYDSDWNPHQDLQAQDRAHRIGQKNEVRILRLITSKSVEEKILERAQYKLDMDGKVIQAGRFDNKSTNEERDAMLRTLLDSAETAEEMANEEEMDDDELNMITARSDEELAVFQSIDEERAKDPEYGPGQGRKPRLMEEDELPNIYLQEDNPMTEEIEEIAGRGARERTRIKYDDGLTEEQWLMAVDDDEDTIEDAIARKNQKIDKRNQNKDKRARKAAGLESDSEPSRDSSIAPAGRKRKATGAKRKADEDIDDEPAPKKKRNGARGSKNTETLSTKERQLLQKILLSNYKALQDLEEETDEQPSEDEDGPVTRGLIDPFEKPVPKAQFPDYYYLIQKPICMDQIKKKIDKEQYQSVREYRDDIGLLCNNARTYNEDGSTLWVDANKIEAASVAKLREDTEKHPELQDFDDSGRSGAVSSVGTPMAAAPGQNGGTKLKLTMNANRDGRDGYSNGISDDER